MKFIKLTGNILGLVSIGCALLFTACGGNVSDKSVNSDSATIKEKTDSIEAVLPDTIDGKPVKKTTAQLMNQMKKSPNWNKYQTGILPKMAEEVPEYCQRLLANEHDRFIIVDKAKMKLFLYDKYGRAEKEYGIACAKNYGTKVKKGDSRTSDGFFSAEGVYDSRNWLFTNDAGYTSPARGVFGPRFIRLKIPNTTQIGIHGTSSPGSIGRRCSHGCIRVTNDNILELVNYVDVGMPIIVSPGPKDIAVNQREGRSIPSVTTELGTPRATADSKMPAIPAVASTTKSSKSEASSASTKTEKAKTESSAAPASKVEKDNGTENAAPKPEATEKATEKPAEKPVEKPAEKPAEKVHEKPAAPSAPAPAPAPTSTPAD